MARKRQSFYSKKEMKDMLDVNENQNYVFMPNEIFSDFTDAFAREEMKGKTSTHITYAYGYYFLATYMWRYARYRNWDNAVGDVPLNEAVIKKFLGFPAKSEQYTYLTKSKTGLLEQIGYITKETNKPCRYSYDDYDTHGKIKEVVFIYESYYKSEEVFSNNKNWKVSKPKKGFYRSAESESEGVEDGTFFKIENTHRIDMDTFIYCMTNTELGVEGFYLYSFLKCMTDKFEKGYDCGQKRMARLTGLSLDEIKNQIDNLERYNMITNDHKPYCLNKPHDKDCKANTYIVLEYKYFAQNLMQMNVIPKQRRISAVRYEAEIGWANEYEVDGNLVNTKTGEIVKENVKAIFHGEDIDDDNPFESI